MEDEINKHAHKVYHKMKDKNTPFFEKVKEVAVEVAIIVFAITVSIWFHNLSEKQHQRKEAREFLLGLKDDLQNDIKEMESDKESYSRQEQGFVAISNLKYGQLINKDSLQKYYRNNVFFGTTFLIPNNGRFEGFKSSGKIGTIENTSLQNDIMDLYQEDILSLMASTKPYVETKGKFVTFYQKSHRLLSDSTSNIQTIMSSDEAKNYANNLSFTGEIRERYQNCINKSKKIIAQIDAQYK